MVQGADALSDDQMRRIAGEFNQAETTFLMRSARADWKLRSFTASGAEVVGAGHNALGAWLWLAERGDLGPLDAPRIFHQEIGSDVLPIELQSIDGRVHGRMRQAPMRLSEALEDVAPLAAALGLDPADIRLDPPPRPVDTGAAHLMVRVADAGAVDTARPDAAALLAVLDPTAAEGCYVYAFDARAGDRPTPGSSTRRWGSGKTRRPEPRPVPWRPISAPPDTSGPRNSPSNRGRRWAAGASCGSA